MNPYLLGIVTGIDYGDEITFIDITRKFGSAESIRVQDEGKISYVKKCFEFMYKLAGSFILMIMYYLKGQPLKGRYTFWYRWIATKAFLSPDRT